MAYVAVDADERLEEGPEGLQFKSFLPNEGSTNNSGAGLGHADRGYLQDQSARKAPGGFWTVEYYQQYFDVDTQTVLKRCYSTLIPTSTSYAATHLNPSPDLYGPFWTLTTLIFTLFLSSSLAASISSYLSDPTAEAFDYDFKLLSIAVTLVYSYGLALPILLWLALRYLGVGEWSVVEAVAVWGYGQFVWIPVSILCVAPNWIFRWTMVGAAFGLSGYFLVVNIYPILATAEAKATRLIIIAIAMLHAGLALTFKLMFFNYYITSAGAGPGGDVPSSGAGNDTTTEAVRMLVRAFV
jgi:hypothetical protein